MAYAKFRHEFKEAVNKDIEFVVTGTNKILWGLIEWPSGYYNEHSIHTGLCQYCGKKLEEHRQPKADSFR